MRIGPIQLAGVSPAMQAKVNTLVDGQTGNEFDTENTAIGLKHAFEDLYQDQGYAAVEVEVSQIDPPVSSQMKPSRSLLRSLSRKAESTSSVRSPIRPTHWFRALKFRRFWQNTRPVPEDRSICFSSPSTTPIMPGAISIAPSFRSLRSTKPRTS